MPLKKKKFIDKKKAVTFRLVHRSQKDPLAADEAAPQRVLTCDEDRLAVSKRRKEEQRKFGVYFDDEYNYLQHLRDVQTVPEFYSATGGRLTDGSETEEATETAQNVKFAISLPSSVFQSHVEEKEGLLNKAAPVSGPRIDWDPDIVAALDDDFDFNCENELDDDFVTMANQEGPREGKHSSDASEEEEEDDDDDDSNMSFGSEESKNLFTNYSMSSSVLPRNQNMKDIDDHFEKFLEQYDDDGIGALDCDDIQGYVKPDSERVQQLANEYADNEDNRTLKGLILSKQNMNSERPGSCSSDEEFTEVTLHEKGTETWDCESILSTYSTTANKPRLIDEPKTRTPRIELSNVSGIPKDTLRTKGLTAASLKMLDQNSNGSLQREKNAVPGLVRKKSETSEEKKERKATVKQIRRERRVEKKANQLAFKAEQQHQEKVVMNVRQNLSGIKLL